MYVYPVRVVLLGHQQWRREVNSMIVEIVIFFFLHRSLAKRALFICILLGIYLLLPVLINAVTNDCLITGVVHFINTILSQLQGCLVAVLYVLSNKQVGLIQHRLWK